MFLDGSERIRHDAVDHYQHVLVPIVASFPGGTPTSKTLVLALARVLRTVGVKDNKVWLKQEAKILRAMLSYVRRMTRKNGRGARPGIPLLFMRGVCGTVPQSVCV